MTLCVTFVILECVRARVCVAFAISSECRSVCVALVAGAGRRCTFTVCTYLLTKQGASVQGGGVKSRNEAS